MNRLDRCFDIYQKELDVASAECLAIELEIERSMNELSSRQIKYNRKNILAKVLLWPFFQIASNLNKGHITHQRQSLLSAHKEEERAHVQLYLRVGRHVMQNDPELSKKLAEIEREHEKIMSFTESLSKVRNAGIAARRDLQDAKESLSGAGTMEMVDLVTKNKAISFASTMSNSSASSAVAKAKRSLVKFNEALESHHRIAAEIEHSMAMEFMDLAFDIFFEGAFDLIGSVLSLFSLSSAETQVDAAIEKLLPVSREIEDNYNVAASKQREHEKIMLEFKNEHRVKAIPLIQERGVDVKDDLLANLTYLYAKKLYD